MTTIMCLIVAGIDHSASNVSVIVSMLLLYVLFCR